MENNYINYKNYGLGPLNNLVYSFIVGWGDKGTYASNKQISDITGLSVETIKRSLRLFKNKGYIKITNSGKKSRHIYQGHTDPLSGSERPSTGSGRPSTGSGRPSMGVTETLYNIDNIINKITNNIDNTISENDEEYSFEDFMNRKNKYNEIKEN